MATVLAPSPARAKPSGDAKLTHELAQAAKRIRVVDAAAGGLALAVLTLAYTLVAVLADRWLQLPAEARLAGVSLFALAFAATTYFLLVRPIRRRVNPRYAARQVEQAIPDAKNAVINWVDLQDEKLAESVRASLTRRAYDQVSAAEVARVAESRRVVWLGAAAGLLLAAMAVLLIVFKPTPFWSLVNRAYNPFTQSGIATRTGIVLESPAGGDLTVTGGEPVVVKIRLTGSVPDKKGADKPRLLVRYTLDAEATDEVPLETLESGRDWGLQLPPSVVQNGFYYTVAAGDARTAEYRVTVRPRPFVKGFEVRLTPPAYTRMREEVTPEPRIVGLRGTKVVLTATTNRPAQSGWLRFDNLASEVVAERVPEQPEQLRYSFTLTESANYRVGFTTTDGEASEPSAAFSVLVEADARPVVTIELPKEEEVTLPANGTLAVDGLATDDFGVRSIALKLRVVGAVPTPFQPRPYQAGKSLKREKDGSYPTRVEYRDSQPFGELKTEAGEPFKLAEGMVVEYFLEAVDTNTEPPVPGANVGRSKVQRVKVGPSTPEPKADPKRQEQEKQHQQQQNQKFDEEPRDPPAPKNGEQQPPQQKQEKQEKGGDPKQGEQGGPPKAGEQGGSKSQPGGKGTEQPMSGDTQPQPPMGDPTQPNNGSPQNSTGTKPSEPPMNPMGTPPQPPMGKPNQGADGKPPESQPNAQPGANGNDTQAGNPPPSPEQKAADEKNKRDAERVKDEIQKQNQQPGAARPPESGGSDPSQPDADPSAPKPPKGADGQTPPKEGPKPENAAEKQPPQGGQEGGASEPKSGGNPAPQNGTQPNPITKPNGGNDTKPNGGETPPNQQPTPDARGGERPAQEQSGGQPNNGGDAKPQKATAPNEPKGKPAGNPSQPEQKPESKAGPQPGATAPEPSEAKPNSAANPGANGQVQQKMDPKELAEAVKDLKSGDKEKQDAARNKLDRAMGKENREAAEKKAEQLERDLKSGDAATKKAAEDEIKEMANQAEKAQKAAQEAGENPGKEKPAKPQAGDNDGKPQQPPEANPPGKEGGAPPKPGDPMGTPPGSADPMGKTPPQGGTGSKPDKPPEQGSGGNPDASGVKPKPEKPTDGSQGEKGTGGEDATKPKGTGAGQPDPKKGGPDAEPAKPKEGPKPGAGEAQLNPSGTKPDATKSNPTGGASEPKRATEKGAGGGEKAGEPAPKPGVEQKDPMGNGDNSKPAGDQAGTGKPSGKRAPTAEEVKELQDKARDLDSKDDAKRQAAEKAVDDAIGKERRKQMQQDAKDLREGKPEEQQAARERLEKAMQDAATNPPADPKDWKPGNAQGAESPGEKLVANERNRLKSAELQLQDFEKNRYNQELLKNLGYTPAQYEEFLKAQQRAFEQQRADLAKLEAEAAKTPTGPATQKVGDAGKVAQRPGAAAGPSGNGSPGVAPPGFSDAQKKFAEAAAKLKRGQKSE